MNKPDPDKKNDSGADVTFKLALHKYHGQFLFTCANSVVCVFISFYLLSLFSFFRERLHNGMVSVLLIDKNQLYIAVPIFSCECLLETKFFRQNAILIYLLSMCSRF